MTRAKKTIVIKLGSARSSGKAIARAARAIREGRLVGFPTETVYGIAANSLKNKALDRLYEVKGRPRGKPFTVHIADIGIIEDMGCNITPQAWALVGTFWPGPLTIILKRRNGGKVGFRMPDNNIALDLISKAKVPVVAPSANLSGEKPPLTAKDVLKSLDGKIDMLIDGGKADLGVESTVVDMTGSIPVILRQGAIGKYEILKAARNAG